MAQKALLGVVVALAGVVVVLGVLLGLSASGNLGGSRPVVGIILPHTEMDQLTVMQYRNAELGNPLELLAHVVDTREEVEAAYHAVRARGGRTLLGLSSQHLSYLETISGAQGQQEVLQLSTLSTADSLARIDNTVRMFPSDTAAAASTAHLLHDQDMLCLLSVGRSDDVASAELLQETRALFQLGGGLLEPQFLFDPASPDFSAALDAFAAAFNSSRCCNAGGACGVGLHLAMSQQIVPFATLLTNVSYDPTVHHQVQIYGSDATLFRPESLPVDTQRFFAYMPFQAVKWSGNNLDSQRRASVRSDIQIALNTSGLIDPSLFAAYDSISLLAKAPADQWKLAADKRVAVFVREFDSFFGSLGVLPLNEFGDVYGGAYRAFSLLSSATDYDSFRWEEKTRIDFGLASVYHQPVTTHVKTVGVFVNFTNDDPRPLCVWLPDESAPQSVLPGGSAQLITRQRTFQRKEVQLRYAHAACSGSVVPENTFVIDLGAMRPGSESAVAISKMSASAPLSRTKMITGSRQGQDSLVFQLYATDTSRLRAVVNQAKISTWGSYRIEKVWAVPRRLNIAYGLVPRKDNAGDAYNGLYHCAALLQLYSGHYLMAEWGPPDADKMGSALPVPGLVHLNPTRVHVESPCLIYSCDYLRLTGWDDETYDWDWLRWNNQGADVNGALTVSEYRDVMHEGQNGKYHLLTANCQHAVGVANFMLKSQGKLNVAPRCHWEYESLLGWMAPGTCSG